MHDGRFLKSSHFLNIWCFLSRFFAQNNSNMIKESSFTCFLNFNFSPKLTVWKGYSLSMMADFQNRLISRIFGVFSTGLFHRTTLTWLKNRFSHVFWILVFHPKWRFGKAIASAWWPIFKFVSFLEYFVFSQPVFCTEIL